MRRPVGHQGTHATIALQTPNRVRNHHNFFSFAQICVEYYCELYYVDRRIFFTNLVLWPNLRLKGATTATGGLQVQLPQIRHHNYCCPCGGDQNLGAKRPHQGTR